MYLRPVKTLVTPSYPEMGYFIKYKNLIIYSTKISKLDWWDHVFKCEIVSRNPFDFDSLRKQFPYANCIKIDLEEQFTSKNLRKTLPILVMNAVLELPEVKVILRDDKLKNILGD